MKLSFHASPNYRDSKSTTEIMMDVTLCLFAILAFSIVWYGMAYGMSYAMRVVGLALTGIISAMATEAIYFKASGKDVSSSLKHSYGWITGLIIVLISKISVSYYAVAVSTIIAIVFGKLVFGGFGQNIFNPAAFGEAVIMNSFASSESADFTTKATPMATMKTMGWVADKASFNSYISDFGGFGNMFLGNFTSVIGGSNALLILLCFAFLVWRNDIKWVTPVVYVGTIAVVSLIAGLFNGDGLWFTILNLLGGGMLFCAVFMLTDPVTTPVTIPGRYMYAVGCAALTVLIRWKANLPDGCLYAILLMNMLTPAIDLACDGSQIKDSKRIAKTTTIVCAICAVISLAVGATLKKKDTTETAASTSTASSETSKSDSSSSTSGLALSDDYSDNEASCTDNGDGSYACKAKGFGLVNNMGGDYKENEATITIENGAVKSVEVTTFGDTQGVGDNATTKDALSKYEGATLDSSVDAVSGATFTSKSVASMVQAALKMANK